jgi:hypothetical protein
MARGSCRKRFRLTFAGADGHAESGCFYWPGFNGVLLEILLKVLRRRIVAPARQ